MEDFPTEVRMPIALHQDEKDLAIWHGWVQGRKQSDLAEQYGCTQAAISQALKRARALIPVENKELYLLRALARFDHLVNVFSPLVDDKDKGAARIVLMTQALEGRYLGLDSPAKLELFTAQEEVRHEQVDVRAELAALLTKIREEQHAQS
jgi:hypothetical protein